VQRAFCSLSADRERFEFLGFLLEFVDAFLQHINDGIGGVTLRVRLAHDLLALGLHEVEENPTAKQGRAGRVRQKHVSRVDQPSISLCL